MKSLAQRSLLCLTLWLVGSAAAQTTTGNATNGGTLYNTNCSGCHGVPVGSNREAIKNAANAGGLINQAMSNGMGGFNTSSFTSTQENDMAAYIATVVPGNLPSAVGVAHNSPGTAIDMVDVFANTTYGPLKQANVVTGGTRGNTVFATNGGISPATITATYTPAAGQCGADTVTYRGANVAGTLTTNLRSFSVVIDNPAAPNISTSAGTLTATTNVAIAAYVPVNTGGTPKDYTLTGALPTGLSFNTGNGQITGTATQSGIFPVTITARNCLDGNLAGQSGSKAVTITSKFNQTITFGALGNKLAADPPFTVSATASSGLAVTFSSATSTVCTVSGNTVTLVSTGTCTINADQAGDPTRYPAPTVSQSFTVGGTQVINFPAPPSTALLGSPPVGVAVTASSGLPVSLTSNNTAVCTVSGASSPYSVTLVAVGVCGLNATQGGNASFAPATPVFRSFTIAPASVRISTGVSPLAVSVNPVTNKIYVANRSSNSVTVIDGASSNTSTVATGALPRALAVNTATNKIYVANSGGSSITVIDGATQAATPVATGVGPVALALNPATNRIYVANYSADSVTIIDGATLATSTVATGVGPTAIAVNPATNKVYVANYGGSMTVIDGTTHATTSVPLAGSGPFAVSVNPVTNRIYVALQVGNAVAAVNGATLAVTSVPVNNSPFAVAANPVTNRIYVANQGGNTVSVIDGATNAVTGTIPVAGGPSAVAFNAVTNQIYVAGAGSTDLTVIDGATNAVTTRAAGLSPGAVGVNPVTNRIYVVNNGSNDVTVADGSVNLILTQPGSYQQTVAFNPVALRSYVPDSASNLLHVFDGASRSFYSFPLSSAVGGLLVNPVNNRVYVNHVSGSISVLDGAGGSLIATIPGCGAFGVNTNTRQVLAACGSNLTLLDGATHAATVVPISTGMTSITSIVFNAVTNRFYMLGTISMATTIRELDATNLSVVDIPVPLTSSPPGTGLAVNVVTNRIYAADAESASVLAIDGATRAMTTIALPSGAGGGRIVINELTNKIYITDPGQFSSQQHVTVIDGASHAVLARIPAGDTPVEVVLDQATNRVYAGNYGSHDLTVVDGAMNAPPATTIPLGIVPVAVAGSSRTGDIVVVRAHQISVVNTRNEDVVGLDVSIQGLGGHVTTSSSPVFPITVSAANPANVSAYYQIDSRSGPWLKAAGSAPNFTASLNGLSRGVHTLYVFATDGQDATSVNGGAQSSPQMSRVESYAFTVIPPPANLTGVFSRKLHGAISTPFDLPITPGVPVDGAVDVEPRAANPGHALVFRFDAPVFSRGTASMVDANLAPIGTVGGLSVTGATSNDIVVPLLGVPDNKRVTVSLSNVLGASGSFSASLGFLVGDVGSSRQVSAADIAALKVRTGPVHAGNFRFDLNANGTVGADDQALAKARSGMVLPTP